jgi:hypothetical protein
MAASGHWLRFGRGGVPARNIVRDDIRELIVEGDKAFVLFDFVTDTAGPVLTGELLRVEDGRVRSIALLVDWRRWQDVLQELDRRTAQPDGADV